MKKICFKCLVEKDISEFYKHKNMGDGYLGKCKSCSRSDVTKSREKRIEYYREYDRNRGNRQGPEYTKEWRLRYPIKYKAITLLNNYLRDNKIKRPDACSLCLEKKKVCAHHDDYRRPLDIRWLCFACHKKWHAKNGEGLL